MAIHRKKSVTKKSIKTPKKTVKVTRVKKKK